MTGQHLYRLGTTEKFWIVDDQRHMDHLLVGTVPLLVKTPMGSKEFPMVRQKNHNRIIVEAGLLELGKDPQHLLVDVLLQLVVKLTIKFVIKRRLQGFLISNPIAFLASGLVIAKRFHRRSGPAEWSESYHPP